MRKQFQQVQPQLQCLDFNIDLFSKDIQCQRQFPIGSLSNIKSDKIKSISNWDHLHSEENNLENLSSICQNGLFEKLFINQGEIGKGGFGKVFKVIHKFDRQYYAVKTVLLDQKKNAVNEKQRREVTTMLQLNSQYIVRYVFCWIEELKDNKLDLSNEIESIDESIDESIEETEQQNSTDQVDKIESIDSSQLNQQNSSQSSSNLESLPFEWDRSQEEKSTDTIQPPEIKQRKIETDNIKYCLYIQMELCEGSTLKDLIDNQKDLIQTEEEKSKNYSQNHRINLFKQIVKGLKYIHSKGIVHRDIKPSNIFLINNYQNIKIGDFGLARNLIKNKQLDNPIKELKMSNNLGTPLYQAPELYDGQYDYSVDIFSLGIILLELLWQFDTQQERVISLLALQQSKKLPEGMEQTKVGKLILKMVDNDSQKRPNADQILKELKNI